MFALQLKVTAVHYAVQYGNVNLVKMLKEYGADICWLVFSIFCGKFLFIIIFVSNTHSVQSYCEMYVVKR